MRPLCSNTVNCTPGRVRCEHPQDLAAGLSSWPQRLGYARKVDVVHQKGCSGLSSAWQVGVAEQKACKCLAQRCRSRWVFSTWWFFPWLHCCCCSLIWCRGNSALRQTPKWLASSSNCWGFPWVSSYPLAIGISKRLLSPSGSLYRISLRLQLPMHVDSHTAAGP